MLSELKNDIGEISESSKRNTGGSSGVQPKGAALTTQSPTVTNSSINPITTQRPVPVSTEAKPNLQTATLMPNVNKSKTQTQIVKAKQQKPLGNNNHVNREKANGSSPQSNKRNRKKMNNPNQGQKAKKQREGIFSQMSCSKIKTSPTCVQIYHECTNERKIEVDRCNRMNSIRKKKVNRRKKLLPKTKASKEKTRKPQKPLRTPNQKPSRIVSNKVRTNQAGKNTNNNSSPTSSASSKKQENQIKEGDGRKTIAKHKKLKLEKKMVVEEIRGLLAYLKQMKDHLSSVGNNNAVKGGGNKNGN